VLPVVYEAFSFCLLVTAVLIRMGTDTSDEFFGFSSLFSIICFSKLGNVKKKNQFFDCQSKFIK
jgi:hypothetical protein